MSLIKHKTVGKVIDETVYYLGVSFGEPEEGVSFEVTYVWHNGYTMIKAVTHKENYKGFGQWFNQYNTRWSSNWNKKRFGRKKAITNLAFEKIEQAYATYLLENQVEQSQRNDTEVTSERKASQRTSPEELTALEGKEKV